MTHIKRAKLFVFLRHHRHELFDDTFQDELATLYAPSSRGQPPIAPAIVQAEAGLDVDVRFWQLFAQQVDTLLRNAISNE